MRIVYLYNMLRMNGTGFLRSRYFVEELQKRGHEVWLGYFLTEDKSAFPKLQKDAITYQEIADFQPHALIFELGSVDRFPSREWLNELRSTGCIILHLGLDLNDYNYNREAYDEMYAAFGCKILKKGRQDAELPNIRASDGTSQIARTDQESLRKYCAIREPKVFEGVPWVSSHHALVIGAFKNPLITACPDSAIKAYGEDMHGDSFAIYGAFSDTNGIEILITGHFVTDGNTREEGQYNRTFTINILEYFQQFHPLKYGISKTVSLAPTDKVSEQPTAFIAPVADYIVVTEGGKFFFISYATADSVIVDRLRANLSAAGLNLWIDRVGLKVGEPDWEEAIRNLDC